MSELCNVTINKTLNTDWLKNVFSIYSKFWRLKVWRWRCWQDLQTIHWNEPFPLQAASSHCVLITATEIPNKTEIDSTLWDVAVTDLTMWFGEDCGRTLELWAGKSLSVQSLVNYAGNLNADSKADIRGLACEVLEGSEDPLRAIFVIFRIQNY